MLGSVCASVRAPLVPRHSRLWSGVWVCVLGLVFGLRSATPGWVFWGLRVFVCALCWYPTNPGYGAGCGCVGSGFGCAPSTPGSGVGVSLCFCSRFACIPPLLDGVFGVGEYAWARVTAAPRHPGWGVRVCVCLFARSPGTPSLLAGACSVGVCARVRLSAAPRHSWLGCWGLCVFA